MATGVVGDLEKKTLVHIEETDVQWQITDFSSRLGYDFESPTFCFANTSWHLQMYTKSNVYKEFMTFYLRSEDVRECSVEYNFGVEKLDGSVEQLMKGSLTSDEKFNETSRAKFIKRTDLCRRKLEFMPFDVLIIRGTLKCQTVQNVKPSSVLEKPKLENLIKLDTLSENFGKLFVSQDNWDTTIYVQDKEYKAHRTVLIARSPVMAAMFQHETLEKKTGIIKISDCEPESFGQFLEFLYTGKLEKPSTCSALHLYETAEKYNVQELKQFCLEYLIGNLTVEKFCEVIVLADKFDETNLLSAAQEFFNENAVEILDTSEWDSLVKNHYRLSKKILMAKMKAC